VHFTERDVDEVRSPYSEAAFERVQALSEWNEAVYSAFLSPWVRLYANPFAAELQKWLHPMRASRYVFSEQVNPWMRLFAAVAPAVAQSRLLVADKNVFLEAERKASEMLAK